MSGGWTMPVYFFRSEPGAAELRRLARRESGRVCQRVLLIANMLEGMEHEEAARLAGLSRSAAYEWHNRYEEDGLEGLRDRPRPGRQPRVDSHGSTPRRVRGSRTGLSLAPGWRRVRATRRPMRRRKRRFHNSWIAIRASPDGTTTRCASRGMVPG